MTFFFGFELEMTIDTVLIEADGPLLSAGTDYCGQRWLVSRCHSDGEGSVWLCSPVTERALRQVSLGRATPRDALRHSCTGLVEVVSSAGDRALPERCLPCGEIPEALLPPPDLRVDPGVDGRIHISIGPRGTASGESISRVPRLCPAA